LSCWVSHFYYYAECHIFTVIMLSVIMLSVSMLSVVLLSVVMLSVIMLSVILLSIILRSVIMLSVIMPSVAYFSCHYAECCYAECHFSECRYAERHSTLKMTWSDNNNFIWGLSSKKFQQKRAGKKFILERAWLEFTKLFYEHCTNF